MAKIARPAKTTKATTLHCNLDGRNPKRYTICDEGLREEAAVSKPNFVSTKDLVEQAFIPAAGAISSDYWAIKRVEYMVQCLEELKGALTAQAYLVAIGVGNSSAVPLQAIVVEELTALICGIIGLALSTYFGSAVFASNAKVVMALQATIGQCVGLLDVLLLSFPLLLFPIRLAQTLCGTLTGLATGPASAALWAHLQTQSDPCARAEVSRKTSNQGRCMTFIKLAIKYSALTWVTLERSRLVLLWLALAAIIAVMQLSKIKMAALPVLNHERLRLCICAWDSTKEKLQDQERKVGQLGDEEKLEKLNSAITKAMSPMAISEKESLFPFLAFAKGSLNDTAWAESIGVSVTALLSDGGDGGDGGDGDGRDGGDGGDGGDGRDGGDGGGGSHQQRSHRARLLQLLTLHENDKYVLGGSVGATTPSAPRARTGTLCVVLKEGASQQDQLRAAFHAHRARELLLLLAPVCEGRELEGGLEDLVRAITVAHAQLSVEWPRFLRHLDAAGFRTGSALLQAGDWRLSKAYFYLGQHTHRGRDGAGDEDGAERKGAGVGGVGAGMGMLVLEQTRAIADGGVEKERYTYSNFYGAGAGADGGGGGGGSDTAACDLGETGLLSLTQSGLVLEIVRESTAVQQPLPALLTSPAPPPPAATRVAAHAATLAAAPAPVLSSHLTPVRRWLSSALLPRGYPASVAPEYMTYQVWDTLQVMCADLRGAVTTQAGLVAIGVGTAGVTPLGVLQVDMICSGVGAGVGLIVGALCDAGRSASTLKRWRVYSTLLSYFQATITLVEAMYPRSRLGIKCIGVVAASVTTPLKGGANTALILHLANGSVDASTVADVAAKENNQDRILGLFMMCLRYTLLVWLGGSFERSWLAAVILSVGHVIFNVLAAQALVLTSLNQQRLQLCVQAWDGNKSKSAAAATAATATTNTKNENKNKYTNKNKNKNASCRGSPDNNIGSSSSSSCPTSISPAAIANAERIFPSAVATLLAFPSPAPPSSRWAASTFVVGAKLTALLPGASGPVLLQLLKLHKNDKYVLGGSVGATTPTASRTSTRTRTGSTLCVVLKEGASQQDQLRAAFHAHRTGVLLDERVRQLVRASATDVDAAVITSHLVDAIHETHAVVQRDWPVWYAAMIQAGWRVENVLLNAGSWRLQVHQQDGDRVEEEEGGASHIKSD